MVLSSLFLFWVFQIGSTSHQPHTLTYNIPRVTNLTCKHLSAFNQLWFLGLFFLHVVFFVFVCFLLLHLFCCFYFYFIFTALYLLTIKMDSAFSFIIMMQSKKENRVMWYLKQNHFNKRTDSFPLHINLWMSTDLVHVMQWYSGMGWCGCWKSVQRNYLGGFVNGIC